MFLALYLANQLAGMISKTEGPLLELVMSYHFI